MSEEKSGRGAGFGCQREAARGREIDGVERTRNQHARPRPQRVFHTPQRVASPRGFNEQQGGRIKTQRGKTGAVEIASFARNSSRLAPHNERRGLPGPGVAARRSQPRHPPHRKPQRKPKCRSLQRRRTRTLA